MNIWVDLHELTGTPQPSKQADCLRKNGIRFVMGADNKPRLTIESLNRQLSNKELTYRLTNDDGFNIQAIHNG